MGVFKEASKKSVAKQIHQKFIFSKVAKKEFRKTVAKYPYHSVQIDFADFTRYTSPQNRNVRFLLVIVDVYSRYMWVIPSTRKKKSELSKKFEEWLKQHPEIENLTSDLEFKENYFNTLAKKYKYKQWFSDILRTGEEKHGEKFRTGLVERSIRTLRERIGHYMTSHNTRKYIDALPSIVKAYNYSVHSAHKKTPVQVLNKTAKPDFEIPKFVKGVKIGSLGRLLLARRKFAKTDEPYWSTELYKVVEQTRNRYIVENIETG